MQIVGTSDGSVCHLVFALCFGQSVGLVNWFLVSIYLGLRLASVALKYGLDSQSVSILV